MRSSNLAAFSRFAWIVSTAYIGLAAVVAWREGTFTSRSVTLGFVNHGGMWGDLIILPVVNGLIVPHLPRLNSRRLGAGMALGAFAIVATAVAHQQWAAMGTATGTTDFVFPNHQAGMWYRDMSTSGYMHVAYMSAELTLVLAYAFTPIPPRAVVLVSTLLTVHLIIGQVQPGWYTTGMIWKAGTVIPTAASVLLTWLVGVYKICHFNDRHTRQIGSAHQ